MRFVLDRVGLVQVSVLKFPFHPVALIPHMFYRPSLIFILMGLIPFVLIIDGNLYLPSNTINCIQQYSTVLHVSVYTKNFRQKCA